MFFNKKLKGAISIFMTIVMISLLTVSGILIDGSRIRSANSIYQSAAASAAQSSLANYDTALKDIYGLFAISQEGGDVKAAVEAMYSEYLDDSLIMGESEEKYTDMIYNAISGLFLPSDYNSSSFFDLYGFKSEEVEVQPIFNLSEQEMLKNQIIEYMKYRAPVAMIDDFFSFNDVQKKMEDVVAESEVMSDRMKIADEAAKIEKLCFDIKTLADELDDFTSTKLRELFASYNDKIIELLQQQITVDDAEERLARAQTPEQIDSARMFLELAIWQQEQLYFQLEDVKRGIEIVLETNEDNAKEANKLFKKLKRSEDNVDKLIAEMKAFLDKYKRYDEQSGTVSDEDKERKAAIQAVKEVRQEVVSFEQIKEDISNERYDETFENVENNHKDLRKAMTESGSSNLRNHFDIVYNKGGINTATIDPYRYSGSDSAPVPKTYDEMRADVERVVLTFGVLPNYVYEEINFRYTPPDRGEPAASSADPRDSVDESAISDAIKQIFPNDSEKMPDSVPSKGGAVATEDFDAKDLEYIGELLESLEAAQGDDGLGKQDVEDWADGIIKEMDFSSPKQSWWDKLWNNEKKEDSFGTQALGVIGGLFGDIVKTGASDIRNNIYINAYALNTFKTRLTPLSPVGDSYVFNKEYSVASRKEAEKTLRNLDKKVVHENSFFDHEIEYIIKGKAKMSDNSNAIFRDILLLRIAINTLAIYSDKESRELAYQVAAAICTAATTPYLIPVVQFLLISAWATAESALEMKHLMNGYKIPLIKKMDLMGNKSNFQLSLQNLVSTFATPSDKCKASDIMLKYEDYLLIYLLMTSEKTKLLRIADLIQSNRIKSGQEDFKMSNAFTYLRVDSSASIKYLFMTQPFLPKELKVNGTDRPKIRTVFYKGY